LKNDNKRVAHHRLWGIFLEFSFFFEKNLKKNKLSLKKWRLFYFLFAFFW